MLERLAKIPGKHAAAAINDLDPERRRAILEFGLRLEVMDFMVARNRVDLDTVNELAGGVVLAFWSRAGEWAKARRKNTGHQEFLEWCEWLAQRVFTYRARTPTSRHIFVVRRTSLPPPTGADNDRPHSINSNTF